MKKEDLLKRLKEHEPIVINYGKGYFSDKEIKDYATWDEEVGRYRDSTGTWSTALLIEILQGEVPGVEVE